MAINETKRTPHPLAGDEWRDWYAIGKEAGESGVDSRTLQATVEDYHKAVSSADKARRGKRGETQKEKERWARLSYNAMLAQEQSEVKRLREENDEKNPKSRISTLLAEASSLDSGVHASESRLQAIGREEASSAVRGEAATANAAYFRRLKRVITVAAGGDAAITIFLTSDYLGVGSFDALAEAYGRGKWMELIVRSCGLALLSLIPYVLSLSIKGVADQDKTGGARKKIERISIFLGGAFFAGAALSYFFDSISKPPLGWSTFSALSTLSSTVSIFGLTTGLVVTGGLAAHHYFLGTQQSKLAIAQSTATRRRLLEQREQIARKQTAMKERRTELLAEIQKKRRELSDAVRRLAEARALIETQQVSAQVAASDVQPQLEVKEAQKGAAAMAMLGWLVGVSTRAKSSPPEQSADYDRKRRLVEQKISGNGHN
jgi:hypothetical protein